MIMQNTPVHTHLWHREFWVMVVANLLLTMSVYMLIPVLPEYLMGEEGMSAGSVGVVMGIYSIGLFALGPFCNWLIQRYRRNRVCIVSALAMALSLCLLSHGRLWMDIVAKSVVFFSLVRFVLGATFGLSQMVLCSTLIIDVSESQYRTSANHATAWFSRVALALGPMLAIVISHGHWECGFSIFDVAAAIALLAVVLILLVRFPFKTPEEGVSVMGLDRFFLPSSWLLFVNLMMMTVAVGLVIAHQKSEQFYALMLLGFFLALLADKFVFGKMSSKIETITGMFLMGVAIFIILMRPHTANYLSPVLLGIGVGIIGSRFLLYFIQVSLHCQRGTSQSSYFLAWEGGLGLGLGLGYVLGDMGTDALVALVFLVCALLGFIFLTHPWSECHKNR
ncbi:MAG: MFS transporter [Prevotella sp.]|nr:MFS transporter [Prevotella sp.]